jgi:hypothetical protein
MSRRGRVMRNCEGASEKKGAIVGVAWPVCLLIVGPPGRGKWNWVGDRGEGNVPLKRVVADGFDPPFICSR